MPTEIYNIQPYYRQYRRTILKYIPDNVKCVLSVGCASGVTEEQLVKRGVKVVGVEINPQAAEIARQRGLTILEGDASEIDVAVAGQSYDCIIYADILEHLPDPEAVLKKHVSLLEPKGTVIVSVPNFRHYVVFWNLFIRGHVRYWDTGILDRTHLRLTTRKMVLEWFGLVDLQTVICKCSVEGLRDRVISAIFLRLADDFLATEIFAVARKP